MKHAKLVITESGVCVTVTHLVLGNDEREVASRATEHLKEHIEQIAREYPKAAPAEDEYESALQRGYWWADLGSEEFTVMLTEPERIEHLAVNADDPALRNHLTRGFVVLTHNPANEPDSRFEAGAYEGPLDFEQAASVCFGLGADSVAALDALNWHLQGTARESID